MNLFGTPGLGSLMGGRIFSGVGQLILAVGGFVLFLAWAGPTILDYLKSWQFNSPPPNPPSLVYALAGALAFALSWLWSLVTSLSLLRQAKIDAERQLSQPGLDSGVPPKL